MLLAVALVLPVAAQEKAAQDQGYKFTETQYDDYYQYSDDCFSVVVDLTLKVTRGNGTIKPYHLRSTLVFEKNEYGKFHAIAMTKIDIQAKQE